MNQLHEKERRQRVQEAKKCALEAEKQRAKEGATRCLSAPTLIMVCVCVLGFSCFSPCLHIQEGNMARCVSVRESVYGVCLSVRVCGM